VSLTSAELADASGCTPAQIAELEHYGILAGGTYGGAKVYDDDALLIAKAAAGLLAHGLEARHLRSYLLSAQREVGILEQAVAPMRRHRDAASRARADELLEELTHHGDVLRSALVRRELRGPTR
jgi:DNA-binding transcriptional MerR regulator